MGGRRTSTGRSNTGQMQPRISSAGSIKSSIIDSLSLEPSSSDTRKLESGVSNEDDLTECSTTTTRKSSFDIISLLEGHEDVPNSMNKDTEILKGDRNHFVSQQMQIRDSSDVPSFWHFVQPETTDREIFSRSVHHDAYKNKKETPRPGIAPKNSGSPAALTQFPGRGKIENYGKRTVRRRKEKKVQSANAKVASFKALQRSPDRLQREGVEWLRVLTPPGTDLSSTSNADEDEDNAEDEEEDDELIKRYFSGLSSAGSSISWAEDAMESEFTSQLLKLWEDIETVCGGGNRPEKMSDAIYEECLQWKKAFPNPDLHRFSGSRNAAEILSPVESPTLDDEEGDDDAQFSSLVNSPRLFKGVKQETNEGGIEQGLNSLQSNFRALNCTTPRPNIEKSTEYVNAWLSECQNSYSVPANEDHKLSNCLESRSRPSSPSFSIIDASNELMSYQTAPNDDIGNKSRHSLRMISDVARSSYSQYSRSHAKFVSDPDPENFFTSLAISNNENYFSPGIGRQGEGNFDDRITSGFGARKPIYPSKIMEYSEDLDEDDRASPSSLTEIVTIRSNVRVQRPISSRIRDHTITPIATGSIIHSSIHGNRYHPANNLNKQANDATFNDSSSRTSALNRYSPATENFWQGRNKMFEGSTNSSSPTSSATTSSKLRNRLRSDMGNKSGYNSSLTHHYGSSRLSQQAQWSRYTGDDSVGEASHVPSVFDNYSNNTTIGTCTGASDMEMAVVGRSSFHSGRPDAELRSPTGSIKNGLMNFPRSSVLNSPSNIPGYDDNSGDKPVVSWTMNRRRLSPN